MSLAGRQKGKTMNEKEFILIQIRGLEDMVHMLKCRVEILESKEN